MRNYIIHIFVIGALLSGQMAGQQVDHDCDKSTLSQNEINRCTDLKVDESEKNLNSIYKDLLQEIKDDELLVRQVVGAERSWLSFRDEFIQAAYPASGPHSDNGSMLPAQRGELQIQLTQEHIQHLLLLKIFFSDR